MPDSATDPQQPASQELVGLMRRLRAECAWKAAQTHRSLARHLLEEAHELAEVLDELEPGRPAHDDAATREHLREELGDVWLQVLLHAAIAEEAGWFDLEDVAVTLREKLLRRNPHVFGTATGQERETDPARVNELWEAAKAGERRREHLLEGIAVSLPALARAEKVLDRRARAGLPAPGSTPETGAGEAPEVELGERLLATVAQCRDRGVDPEQALRDALRRLPS